MKNRATIVLVVLNVIGFIWEAATGGFDTRSLYYHGALCRLCVTEGHDWWRIFSSGFLHAGITHIALNMFALFQIGTVVEYFLGSWRMLAIYFIAMTGGGLGVVYFGDATAVTVGASGAIFGLFGALVGIGVRQGGVRGRRMIGQTVPTVLVNLVFTFAIPFISKEDHVGGLISGFLAGLIFYAIEPEPEQPVVTDTQTGETAEAEYLAPDEPNGPSRLSGVP